MKNDLPTALAVSAKSGDKNLNELKILAVRGFFVLFIRKTFLRFINFIGTIILFRLLSPQIFGDFATLSQIVLFFQLFSDVGLGAALIQKKDIKEKDLQTTFTIQLFIVLILWILTLLLSPFLISFLNLGPNSFIFIFLLTLSVVIVTLRSIPSILLERKLLFQKLVIPEIAETVIYFLVAVSLAYLGFGISSFILAIFLRSILGTIIIYLISPWKVGLAFDKNISKNVLTFGLPYQSNGFLAFVKDSVTPFFVRIIYGNSAVGYLNFAFTVSKIPIEFISDIFRITFPAYAKIQNQPQLIKKSLEKTLYMVNFFLFPSVFFLMATIDPLVKLVFSPKWAPAIPSFYIHSLGVLVVGVNNLFYNSLWSLGKVKEALKIMIISTVINWLASLLLIKPFGINGIMMASVLVLYLSLPLSIMYLRKIVYVDIWGNIHASFFAGLISGIIIFIFSRIVNLTIISLALTLLIGAILYLLIHYATNREKMLSEIRWLVSVLWNKN